MKKIWVSILLLLYHNISFSNGAMSLAMPSPMIGYNSDRFRAGDLECQMAIGSGVNVEFGVIGTIANTDNTSVITTAPTNPNKDVGVYGRIIIPIGMPKGRLDCTHLYDIELSKKRIELQKLRDELDNLKSLKFENNTK